MAQIRIIKKEKKLTFAEQLEQRARHLVKNAGKNQDRRGTTSALERELALTLSHMNHVRESHDRAQRSLLRQECYLDTEIIQREPQEPVYQDPRLPERDRLRDRLRNVEKERRRLGLIEAGELRGLQSQLLDVMNRMALATKTPTDDDCRKQQSFKDSSYRAGQRVNALERFTWLFNNPNSAS